MATEDLTHALDEAGAAYELLPHAHTESALGEAEALGSPQAAGAANAGTARRPPRLSSSPSRRPRRRESARAPGPAIIEYLGWFNNARLHESLGDIPPVEFEQQQADREAFTLAGATA
ncbi:MAG: hypothetical protein M3P15_09860 [Actinomycetota bacterium]|nr:hypothetical protein [Actinomycetota bacterium]